MAAGMRRDLSPHPLARHLRPRSVVFYGASERLYWMRGVQRNLERFARLDSAFAVNRSGADVYGIPGFTRCSEIGREVDAAYVLVSAARVPAALRELADIGVHTAVVLASSFAECGADGAALQREISELAQELGIALIGPNCLGFVNASAGAVVSSLPLPTADEARPGRVAVVGQSGGLVAELVLLAGRMDVGLSFYCSTGNEAGVTVSDLADYLVDDEATGVIALCAEQIRRPETFLAAARRAREKRKPIIVLKVGSTPLTRQVALAHTGALVGDDGAFDAMCASLAVTRVHSLEELIVTASVFDTLGALEQPGLAFVTISGGASALISDAAARYGVALPELAPATRDALSGILPRFARPLNPLDVTGGATSEPAIFTEAIGMIAADPSVARVVSVMDMPALREPLAATPLFRAIGAGLQRLDHPTAHLTASPREITANLRDFASDAGIARVIPGIDEFMKAAGALTRWSDAVRKPIAAPGAPPPFAGGRPADEHALLDALAGCGVRVIPARLCTTAEEAVEAAAAAGGPVALKIVSADIPHKTEVGGVRLNLSGEAQVRTAFGAILEATRAASPDAAIRGISVAPMRKGGVELLVGVARDPEWGLVLSVALGGIFTEALDDSVSRLLPVDEAGVLDMLATLRGARILDGYRGGPRIDRRALAGEILAIAAAARAIAPELDVLEVNPLLASEERIEVLDALALWSVAS